MLALDVFSFCFPDEGHRENLPLCLFHKLCVHMHGNKAKFEWNVLVQSTRVLSHDLHGKTKQLNRFIDLLNHDSWSFSEKKKVNKQGWQTRNLRKAWRVQASSFGYPVSHWVSCACCSKVYLAWWIDYFVIACSLFSLHCIWIPVYPVRGVGRLPPGPTLTLLYTGFERKGTLFIYFLLTKWYPFYIPSLELLDVLELL